MRRAVFAGVPLARCISLVVITAFLSRSTSAVNLGRVTYSTFFGSPLEDRGQASLLSTDGGVWMAGVENQGLVDFSSNVIRKSGNVMLTRWTLQGTLDQGVWVQQLGGLFSDESLALCPADCSAVWSTGVTYSQNFPNSTVGGRTILYGGAGDAFLVKVSRSGTLEASQYLGGDGLDEGRALAPAESSGVWVGGSTASDDFPITGSPSQVNYQGGSSDAFLTRYSVTGPMLVSGFVGGRGNDAINALVADGNGGVWFAGESTSDNFPTEPKIGGNLPFQVLLGGGKDVVIGRVDRLGVLRYSSFMGAGGDETAHGMARAADGGLWMVGETDSVGLPITVSTAYQRLNGGGVDAFVAKWSSTGELKYLSYLGGAGTDVALAVEATEDGGCWIVGYTDNTNGFPTRGKPPIGRLDPPVTSLQGGEDAFIIRLNTQGGVQYSSLFGGAKNDRALSVSAASPTAAWVVGWTEGSWAYPTIGGYQSQYGGGDKDAFIVKIDEMSGSALTRVAVTPSTGIARAGAVLTLSLRTLGDESLLTAAPGCTINGRDVTASFDDLGTGEYTFRYTVGAADPPWRTGSLPLFLRLTDFIGRNLTATATTDGNTLTGAPAGSPPRLVTPPRVEPNEGPVRAGETVRVIVSAELGETGLLPGSVVEVAGVDVTSTFTALPDGSYAFERVVPPGSSPLYYTTGNLPMNIFLRDVAGNEVSVSVASVAPVRTKRDTKYLWGIVPVLIVVFLVLVTVLVYLVVLDKDQKKRVKGMLGMGATQLAVPPRRQPMTPREKLRAFTPRSSLRAYTPRVDVRQLTPRAIMSVLTPKGTLADSYQHFDNVFDMHVPDVSAKCGHAAFAGLG
eukprot:jgi/Mesvir1/6699/Mv13732-RA.3